MAHSGAIAAEGALVVRVGEHARPHPLPLTRVAGRTQRRRYDMAREVGDEWVARDRLEGERKLAHDGAADG
jgi:hypothetical protein